MCGCGKGGSQCVAVVREGLKCVVVVREDLNVWLW